MPSAAVELKKDSGDEGLSSSSSFKVNNFDLIRLFAALQVLIFHSLFRFDVETPAFISPLGWFSGVPIFFVVSGFLISSSFERQRGIRRYAQNRALRILPGLWGCLCVTAAVTLMLGYPLLSSDGLIWLVAQSAGVIYTPEFLRNFGMGSYNGSLWTIPVELQFYCMLPIIYLISKKLKLINSGFIIFFSFSLCIGVFIAYFLPEIATAREPFPIKLIRYSFIPRFYLFLWGVVLQRLHIQQWSIIRGKGLIWLAGYCLFRLVFSQNGLIYIADELLVGVTAISLAYTVPTLAHRLLRGNDISYGVYLYHGLIINILYDMGHKVGEQWIAVTLLIAAMAAYLSWVFVERPMIRSKAKRFERSTPPDTAMRQTDLTAVNGLGTCATARSSGTR